MNQIYVSSIGEVVMAGGKIADAIVDESGNSFFEAKIQTDKNNLRAKDGGPLEIIPGKKSILDYLLKLFYKARYTALRER